MNFLFNLVVATFVAAIVLWPLTALIGRFRLSLTDTARISVACLAGRRLISFVAGLVLANHPRLRLYSALVLGFAVQAEILHLDLAGRAERFHKPMSWLFSVVLILADCFVSAPLAAWLWGWISP